MTRIQRTLVAALALVSIALASFAGGMLASGTAGRRSLGGFGSDGRGFDLVREAFEEIRSTSVDPPDEDELARGAVRGMVQVLKKHDDPYALFYSQDGYRRLQELTTGRFSGIGVWLKDTKEGLQVSSVLPASPALEAGVARGDIVRLIDGKPVAQMTSDEAVTRIKGPEGTVVDLGLERDGDMLSFSIERKTIDLPTVKTSRHGPVGYVRLFGFSNGAASSVRRAVRSFRATGVSGIVLDLRDNGGGLFDEAVDVSSVFIEDGDVVIYRDGSGDDVSYEADGDAYEALPLVVLVNGGTASAAEIVAGALQDHERAVLVGTSTYGKGSVQNVLTLGDDSALKLTTAAYLTPHGRSIDGKGLSPDVEVDNQRAQRRRAFAVLRRLVASRSSSS